MMSIKFGQLLNDWIHIIDFYFILIILYTYYHSKAGCEEVIDITQNTERAVFVLKEDGIHLVEIAPGIDIERAILSLMEFKPIIAENIKDMDKLLFL